MKVDPNQAVDTHHEMVLCEDGNLVGYDGSRTPVDALNNPANSFRDFCESLDPNKCWILALVPRDRDREVFFRAREVASEYGLHMQAPLETPERCQEMWRNYTAVKKVEERQQAAK